MTRSAGPDISFFLVILLWFYVLSIPGSLWENNTVHSVQCTFLTNIDNFNWTQLHNSSEITTAKTIPSYACTTVEQRWIEVLGLSLVIIVFNVQIFIYFSCPECDINWTQLGISGRNSRVTKASRVVWQPYHSQYQQSSRCQFSWIYVRFFGLNSLHGGLVIKSLNIFFNKWWSDRCLNFPNFVFKPLLFT